MYITINDAIHEGRQRPFEIFINSKNLEHYAWCVALTRMISAVFRRGGELDFVVEELKAVFDPRGGHWQKGRYVPSLLAAIGDILESHLITIGFITAPNASHTADADNTDPPPRHRHFTTTSPYPPTLPQVLTPEPHPPGRLRLLHLMRLFEVLLVSGYYLVEPRRPLHSPKDLV